MKEKKAKFIEIVKVTKIRVTKKQKDAWKKQIDECLQKFYRVNVIQRNRACYQKELSNAIEIIEKGEKYILKRAQFGAKFGNYYKLIMLNSSGNYQYAEGFSPEKYID